MYENVLSPIKALGGSDLKIVHGGWSASSKHDFSDRKTLAWKSCSTMASLHPAKPESDAILWYFEHEKKPRGPPRKDYQAGIGGYTVICSAQHMNNCKIWAQNNFSFNLSKM